MNRSTRLLVGLYATGCAAILILYTYSHQGRAAALPLLRTFLLCAAVGFVIGRMETWLTRKARVKPGSGS